MNKKLFLILTASVFALLSSCGDTVVDAPSPSDQPITKANVTVRVRDAYSQKLIEGATVTLLSTGAFYDTGEAGDDVKFSEVYIGTHGILIEASGFATMRYGVEIKPREVGNSDRGNFYFAADTLLEAYLYPTTGKLEGYLFVEDKDGIDGTPANGQTVRFLAEDERIVDRVRNATVTDGKYTFSNLPVVGTEYSLTGLAFEAEDRHYGAVGITAVNLHAGGNAVRAETKAYKFESEEASFKILSFPTVVDEDKPIVITFSNDLDLDRILTSDVTVENDPTADVEWKAKSLTITPSKGTWPVSVAATLELKGSGNSLRSVKGDEIPFSSFTKNVSILRPDLSDEQVGGLRDTTETTIDISSGKVKLHWKKVVGASGYYVYRKETNDPNATYESVVDDPISDTVATFNILTGEKSYTYAVRATNGSSITKWGKAAEIQIDKKPTATFLRPYAANSSGTFFGWDGLLDNTTPEIQDTLRMSELKTTDATATRVMIIEFNEPMDMTTAVVTPTDFDVFGGRANVTRFWDNPTTLRIVLSINLGSAVPGPYPKYASFMVSGLKSFRQSAMDMPFEFKHVKNTTDRVKPVLTTPKSENGETGSFGFNLVIPQ
jgi:hypothetical protein